MYPGGYTAEVTSLSAKATEKDVRDFFAYCGEIIHVEIMRSDENSRNAYITFKDAYALETAIVLSGATIGDQPVHVSRWGSYTDEIEPLQSMQLETRNSSTTNNFVATPGEAVTMAQQVVTTMISKGFILGKDALVKAKAFDESHNMSGIAMAKVAELSNRIGLTEKVNAGLTAVKSVDEKYKVSELTMSAASYTGRTAMWAANGVVNSSYFAKGALWASDILARAAKGAADLSNVKK